MNFWRMALLPFHILWWAGHKLNLRAAELEGLFYRPLWQCRSLGRIFRSALRLQVVVLETNCTTTPRLRVAARSPEAMTRHSLGTPLDSVSYGAVARRGAVRAAHFQELGSGCRRSSLGLSVQQSNQPEFQLRILSRRPDLRVFT